MNKYPVAKAPLILRFHRLMDVFSKSDDERDFYLDRVEGFIVYVDLDKEDDELNLVYKELNQNKDRFSLIPKMAFYEIKKFMEGFVQEKVFDIDVKEKLLDIIGTKEARENFLEFIYDNLVELEKWQQYYQERFRIRIIEQLRLENIKFVFEEDLDFSKNIIEKFKQTLFDDKVPKEISNAREIIKTKSKTYYSSEALNPRPKRGRPPKQAQKVETTIQITLDIYTQVPKSLRMFLYVPEISSAAAVTFSAKFETEEQLLASLRGTTKIKVDEKLEALSRRLESLQSLSTKLQGAEFSTGIEKIKKPFKPFEKPKLSETKKIELSKQKEFKIEEAISEILPKGNAKISPQRRRAISIKKVSKIKSSKKKK
ncbi:MAG: hypothetical protein K1060chlam5_00634 [Candidatus Anoxychlamydiales bacterium]|nr:hypothetical protein [Candidatus Anoxychlamydiales bacterium]